MTERDRPAATRPPEPDTYPQRWRALAVCMAAGVMIFIDVSIVNVALPSFQTGLGASSTDLSWIVAGYTLTFGLVLVPGGRMGDARGRKRMFVLGLVLFAASSVAAGLAMSPLWLVAARLLQGAAGGLLNPQLLGLIQQMFSGRERGTAFGVFGAVNASSTAIGPLIGGLLIDAGGPALGWRLVFLVNLPFALAALLLEPKLLPPDPVSRRHERSSLDPVGAGLLGASVLAVLLPLVLAHRDPASAPWWTIAVGAVLMAGFIRWERRYADAGRDPLANGRVLTSPGYVLGTSLGTLYMAGSTAIFFVLTVYFQQGQGYTALEAGLASMPYAVGSAVAAAVGGRLVDRLGRPLVVAGTVVIGLGLAGALVAVRLDTGSTAGLLTAVPLFVSGIGSGMVITPNQALTLAAVPSDEGGTAAGMQQTAQRVGSSLGIALVSSVFFTVLADSGEEYGTALVSGLLIVLGFVALSFLLGLGDLVRRRRPRTHGRGSEDRAVDHADDRHCLHGHAAAGHSPAGHTYH